MKKEYKFVALIILILLTYNIYQSFITQKEFSKIKSQITQVSDNLEKRIKKNDNSYEIDRLKGNIEDLESRISDVEIIVDDIDRFTSQNRFLLAD